MNGVRLVRGVAALAGTIFTLALLNACMPIQPMATGEAAPAASEQVAATGAMTETEATTESAEVSGTAGTAESAALMMASSEMLGDFVADGAGMTLYQFDKDTQGTADAAAVSNCYDKCAESWPPLLTEEEDVMATAGDGLDAALVGVTERKDGTYQVTYNGWPLYYWYDDVAAGDTKGQAVGNVWWVLTPAGDIVRGMIKLGKSDALGDFVVDMNGMTLYQFDKDTQGAAGAEAVSNCNDQCAEAWPPLLIDEGARLLPGAKIDGALLGETERADGTYQVTLNGWPLYYYYEDAAEGDTNGQASHDVWWVVNAAGEPIH